MNSRRPQADDLCRPPPAGNEQSGAATCAQETLARAWSLKEAAYAAWSSEPTRAATAAAELQALACAHPDLPLIDALARWTSGIASLAAGQTQPALDHLEAAEAGLLATGQPLAAAQTLVPRIMALALLGRHADSVSCAGAAHRRLAELGDKIGAAKVNLNLAALHIRRNEGAAAVEPARRAGALFARLRDHPHSVMADVSLADALAASGDLDEAQRVYARAAARAAVHELPVLHALADESAAIVHQVRGQWREALAGLESARRRYAGLGMVHHQAVAEKQLADAYLELRLLPESRALYDTAVSRFAELDVPDERAWALVQRTLAAWRMGDADAAAADLRQAGGLFDALDHCSGAGAVLLARAELADGAAAVELASASLERAGADALPAHRLGVQLLLSQALLREGRLDEARRGFDAVVASAGTLGLQPLRARAHAALGDVALRAGALDDARAQWHAAIDAFEMQRRALPGLDLRRAFVADHLRPYHGLIRLLLAGNAPDAPQQVLRLLERYRARTAGLLAQPRSGDEIERRLRERLDWLSRRLQRLQDDGEHDDALEREARGVEAELLEALRRGRLVGAAADGEATADPLAICARLQADEGVIVYAALDDELFAVVLRSGGARLVREVAVWSEVRAACAALRNQMQTLAAGRQRLQPHLRQLTARAERAATRLRGLLCTPLEPALQGAMRLMIVPHGELAELPWAAVADTRATGRQIVQAPSVSMALGWLGRPRQAARPPRTVLAWGDTERLQHAGDEAQAVARLYALGHTLLGPQADRRSVDRLAPGAEVLHFACHARFRRDNPAFSALQLADGEMDVERVQELRLSAELVVLAACETGQAELGAADDSVGLVQAFLAAGARRVLATQWPLDDALGALLMLALHRALAAGHGPAAALGLAQRELAAEHPHPYHWAAVTLHGAW